MKVGIVGSRRRCSLQDARIVSRIVQSAVASGGPVVIVSGGCRLGADRFAEESARIWRLPTLIHPIPTEPPMDPGDVAEFRRRAYERNSLISRDSDVLFALVADDRRGGTEDTVRKSILLGRRVWIVTGAGLCVAAGDV